MSFGVFESALSSEQEVGLARQAAVDQREAAIYDVREKLGPSLFASRDLQEFRDRVAMMKNDQSIYKVIEPHIHPSSGVVRSIIGKNSVLEKEFKAKREALRTAGLLRGASDYTDRMFGPGMDPEENKKKKDKKEDKEASRRRADLGADMAGGNKVAPTPHSTFPGQDFDMVGDHDAQDQLRTPAPAAAGTTARRRRAEYGATPVDTTGGNKVTPDLHPAFPGQNLDMVGDHDTQDRARTAPAPAGTTAGRRRADFDGEVNTNATFNPSDGELEPTADWEGYKGGVDQGAEGKVKGNFASRMAWALYTDWCEATHRPPNKLASLDAYADRLTDAQYFRLARTIRASDYTDRLLGPGMDPEENQHHPKTPKGQSKDKLKDVTAGRDPIKAYTAWCQANGFRQISARNVEIFAGGDVYLTGHLAFRVRRALRTAWHRQATDIRMARRRTAAPDYLQKADDALTQLLNQKAQEFQETIAPLQQALTTVQQAEQIQQSQNPMNVLPPPGTVNVMPGGDQGPAGMPAPGAQDLGAAATALAGAGGDQAGGPQGAPPPGGPAPVGGEDPGAPPPAAAGGGLPPELMQMQGRRREAWPGKKKKQESTPPGGPDHFGDWEGTDELFQGDQSWTNGLTNKDLDPWGPGGGPLTKKPFPNSDSMKEGRQRYAYDEDAPFWDDPDQGPKGVKPGAPRKPNPQRPQGYSPGGWGGDSKKAEARKAGTRKQSAPGDYYDEGGYHDEAHGQRMLSDDMPQGHAYGHQGPSTWEPDDQSRKPGRGQMALPPASQGQLHPVWKEYGYSPEGISEMRGRHPWAQNASDNDLAEFNHSLTLGDGSASFNGRDFATFKQNQGNGGNWLGRKPGEGYYSGGVSQDYPGFHPVTGEPLSAKTAANVTDLWKKWQQSRGQSGNLPMGGEPDYEAFASEFGVGQRALNKLRTQEQGVTAKRRYLKWCHRHRLQAASTRNFYWYLGQVPTREARLLTAEEHGYDPANDEQIFAPAKGHGWEHSSGPSGKPYVRPQGEHGRHEGSVRQAWSGWGPAQFPRTRQVEGWNWDKHLAGYLANAPQRFACECGSAFNTPNGFHRCACGKQWNSYVIGNGGSSREASADKYIVREIPTRADVIVANRQLANIHDLTEPGELAEGEDDGMPSFRQPPTDWARRGDGARWQGSPIGS